MKNYYYLGLIFCYLYLKTIVAVPDGFNLAAQPANKNGFQPERTNNIFMPKSHQLMSDEYNANPQERLSQLWTSVNNKKIKIRNLSTNANFNKRQNDNIYSTRKPVSSLFENYQVTNSPDQTVSNPTDFPAIESLLKPGLEETGSLLWRILNLDFMTTTTTTTTPKPIKASEFVIKKIFEPLIGSIERELQRAKKTQHQRQEGLKTFTVPQSLFNEDKSKKDSIISKIELLPKQIPSSSENIVKSNEFISAVKPSTNQAPSIFQNELNPNLFSNFFSVEKELPLSTLLQSIGMDARPKAENVHIGHDKSISVLGMPVGRRDGIALSPLTGVSLGNQDMFGPIAVNNRYDVKWDFLDKLQSVLTPPS